ncbi:MAG: amidophosphoribosyltransferase [Bacillota bacterium]|nr:amidophosphoribosyltransferase [Bacillota bacterium]
MPGIHEECGVLGIYRKDLGPVAEACYLGLCALQHRGQESCGIAVNEDGLFRVHQDAGLVSEVMNHRVLDALGKGNIAVGHVRYGTDQTRGRADMQPTVIEHRKGRLALANNGSLTNYMALREDFESKGFLFHTTGDAEIISCVITRERLTSPSIEQAVLKAMNYLQGSFTFVLMSPRKLIAVRGPSGFRPLCYGRADDGSFVVASESCALTTLGITEIIDIKPGEMVMFDEKGVHHNTSQMGKKKPSICVFEYIYFARPDSVLDGVSVHAARAAAGEYLAKEHPVEADIVIGVPDSGIDGAIGYARAARINYGMGFVKNKYIGRTFINPGEWRKASVHIKLSPVSAVVKDKRVVLVDDSIVRGTTSELIVGMLKKAGAKEVHLRITAPPFMNPCYYGTDIKSKDSLIACRMSQEEIRKKIGADSLGFLSLEAVRKIAAPIPESHFCSACFDGKYPTDIPDTMERDRYSKRLVRVGENV